MDSEQLDREGSVSLADFVSEVDYFSRLVWQSIERNEKPNAEQMRYLKEACVEFLEFNGFTVIKPANAAEGE